MSGPTAGTAATFRAGQAKTWLSYGEASSAEAQAGGEYALVCAATAQAHAILAVAEAISELTGVIANRFSE